MYERFTKRARHVIVTAQDESRHLKHNYIGTEHLLLGIARENQGVAARILLDFSADANLIRSEILSMLSGQRRKAGQTDVGPELEDEVVFRYGEHALPIVTRFIPPLVLGWLLFGVALGIGVLVGWAIWGL